jgi:hypothetical protein
MSSRFSEGEPFMATTVTIKAPNFNIATFRIRGTAPLVIRRYSAKLLGELEDKILAGSTAGSKRKKHEPRSTDDIYNEARYRSADGWDGFNASGIRCGLISACRLVSFKMTLAKLSLFVIADGVDAQEPQISLIRILGAEPRKQPDIGRVSTGEPYLMFRPAYDDWSADLRIRFDADQFNLQDVTNLLTRVGMQVGVGEGRPDSKKSAGMGWGLFEIERAS